jgi:hypothetical protein
VSAAHKSKPVTPFQGHVADSGPSRARNPDVKRSVRALSRLRDLLRPGGLLLILGVREGGMGAFLGRLYRFRPYSLGQLRAGLSACGLVGIRTIPLRPREFPANLSRVAMLARRP